MSSEFVCKNPARVLLSATCWALLTCSAAAASQVPAVTTRPAIPAQAPAGSPVEGNAARQLDPPLARAESLAEGGKAVDAEREVRQYLVANPKAADGHFLLGYILFREIQREAAGLPLKSFNAHGVNSDSQPSSYKERSGQSGARSQSSAADPVKGTEDSFPAKARASLAEFTEGAKYRTPSAFDLKIVALDYILLEDYFAADKWLTKMLEWTPKDSEGWYYLGRTKYNERRFEQAIDAFQKCLRLDPKNVKAEDNLGLSYAALNRGDEASSAYLNAMDWQKNAATKSPWPFIDMAALLLEENRSAEAVGYLQQAIEIAPSDVKAHELLGKAYSHLDQLAQAQSELEKAVELAPENANLPCMLAPLYRRRGLLDKAKAQVERCAELHPHSSSDAPRP